MHKSNRGTFIFDSFHDRTKQPEGSHYGNTLEHVWTLNIRNQELPIAMQQLDFSISVAQKD